MDTKQTSKNSFTYIKAHYEEKYSSYNTETRENYD